MEKINLFGASGHAKVIRDIISSQGNLIGCMYDDSPRYTEISGIPIYKASSRIIEGPIIISIGSNQIRKQVSARYRIDYAKAVHHNTIISPTAKVGDGTVIMQGAIVQADTRIGRHCIINTAATVDHECIIGDFVHISPHATLCGNVHIGEGSWIGAGATIVPGIKIGKWCIVGAGSTVIKDVPDNTTVVGTPAKDISKVQL